MATPGGESDESSSQQQTSCQVDDQLQPVPSASRRERLRGGYECEIVRSPEKIQTECSICLQVLREPQLISCCGHNFCRTCIERVKKDGKNCPLCNEAGFTLMHNKGLERSMKEFEVFCTHRKSGCRWTGELRMFEQHLNVNPEAEKQLDGCEFVGVKCMYECGHCLQRYVLGNHQSNECPKRPFSCDYCREYESTFEDVANNHYAVCKCYPLSCPNNCTPYAIERQNLQRHLDNDCPLQVVDCDFHYIGCEVKLPRRDMPAHLAENFTHMSLLATFNQKLIQIENDKMAKVILEKDEEIKQLTEDLRREVVASQTAIDDLKQENEALRQETFVLNEESQTAIDDLKQENEALRQETFVLKEESQTAIEALRIRTQSLEDQLQQDNESLRQETQMLRNQLEREGLALKDVRREGEKLRRNIAVVRGELANQKKTAIESTHEVINRSKRELTAAAIRREEALKDGLQQALRQETQTLKNQLERKTFALKEEILEIRKKEFVSKETLEEEVAHLKQDTTSKAQYQFLKAEVGQLKKDTVPRVQHLALQASVEKIHHHVSIVPVQLTMTNYVKHKRDDADWYNEPFYTHPHGYKMCLNVNANGEGDGEGTHVSVFVCLMRGEFDDHLKWPFRGDITIQLLNQLEDKEHHTQTFPFTDETSDDIACRVTTRERGLAWGYHEFIAHSELNYNFAKKCQYLKNDCLRFRVAKVELTN